MEEEVVQVVVVAIYLQEEGEALDPVVL